MDQQTLLNILLGLVSAGLVWFATTIWNAVQVLKEDLKELEVNLPKEYVAKVDYKEDLRALKQEMRDGFTKIDHMLDQIWAALSEKADK